MSKSIAAPLLLTALLIAACEPQADETAAVPATETAAPVDVAAEEQRIRQLDAEWIAAVEAKDVERIVGMYAQDGRIMAPNAPSAEGHEALRQTWTQMLEMPGLALSFEPTDIEVAPSGDMAYDVGTYTFAFDGPQGRVEDNGKYLVVWTKENDEWKVAADMFNTNVPLPQ